MLSINTNLSSLVAQSSLKESTNALNLAIERMTTGLKINHASDNAANYSISTNMTTQIGAYKVAEENALMGVDMLTAAEDTLEQINDKIERIRALQEQANNGTCGEKSLQAINTEVNALIDEVERLYSTAEYNGIKLFTSKTSSANQTGGTTDTTEGFVNSVTHKETVGLKPMSKVSATDVLAVDEYVISTAEDLQKLATLVNNGKAIEGSTFVLANNIDLSSISDWESIGVVNIDPDSGNPIVDLYFSGTFDGNGYVISGLKDNAADDADSFGSGALFGLTKNATIKNLGVEDVDITVTMNSNMSIGAGLVAFADSDLSIDNCYTTGKIKATGTPILAGVLGIHGMFDLGKLEITDTNSSVNLQGDADARYVYCCGLAYGSGGADVSVENCSYTGNISDTLIPIGFWGNATGGTFSNCNALGTSTVDGYALMDQAQNVTINDTCYKKLGTGPIIGTESNVTYNNVYEYGMQYIGNFKNAILRVNTDSLAKFSSVSSSETITSGTYSISTPAELEKLATMTNLGLIKGGEFVLAKDIDLSSYSNWTPIGATDNGNDLSTAFTGTFNGNGYTISNLTITARDDSYGLGLFGVISGNSCIKNLGIENAKIDGSKTYAAGIIVGQIGGNGGGTSSVQIENCYTTGTVGDAEMNGGFLGSAMSSVVYITDSYSNADVSLDQNNRGDDVTMSSINGAGGLAGVGYFASVNIENSYSTGNISSVVTSRDKTYAGGLIAYANFFNNDATYGTTKISNSFSTGIIAGTSSNSAYVGGLVGGMYVSPYDNCISGCYYNSANTVGIGNGANSIAVDLTAKSEGELNSMIPDYTTRVTKTAQVLGLPVNNISIASSGAVSDLILQIGIHAGESNSVQLNTGFKIFNIDSLRKIGLDGNSYFSQIDALLNSISAKQVEYGAALNRLESALEEISTQYENLVSSRSTIRDADIAEVSAEYIQKQILQQASATLMATANQSPSIALQLI